MMTHWAHIGFVACGGAIGAVSRYLVYAGLSGLMPGYPLASVVVNILGSFALGAVLGWVTLSTELKLFVAMGFLGAFTTFSTFSMDLVHLAQIKDIMAAGFYLFLSVTGGVAAYVLGHFLIKGSL